MARRLAAVAGLISMACSGTTPNSSSSAAGSSSLAGTGGSATAGSGGAQQNESGSSSGGNAGALTGMGGAGADAGGNGGSAGNAGASGAPASDPTDPTDLSLWKLVWSDDFNDANGSPPDPSKWTREVRGGNASNKEAEYYTDSATNSQQNAGNLEITALKEVKDTYQYTSARLNSYMHYSAAYGRVETRAKMPAGQGLWPAFWMLGDNKFDAGVGWPKCGEIDIMETVGNDMHRNHGSLHGFGYSGGQDLTATVQLTGQPLLSDDFHIYAVEWAPDSVKFFIDTMLYETRTPKDVPAGSTWAFNHPFFITLNLAVGDVGSWPGAPDATTHFPAKLLVDYVRVYSAK